MSAPIVLTCWVCGEPCDAFEGDEHPDGAIGDCYCGAANALTYFTDGTWALTRPLGVDDKGRSVDECEDGEQEEKP